MHLLGERATWRWGGMKRMRLEATVVLAIGLVGATVAVGHTQAYVLGQVAHLIHFEDQGYFVEVQTTSERITVEVSEELWKLNSNLPR
jgi:hypothetical protein